jgi:hypothetical protein
VLGGVVDEVGQHLLEAPRVDVALQRALVRDEHPGRQAARGDQRPGEGDDVGGPPLGRPVRAGQLQQVGDQRLEALHLGVEQLDRRGGPVVQAVLAAQQHAGRRGQGLQR